MAPLILDAIGQRPECAGVVLRIIQIAAAWDRFDLVDTERQEAEAKTTVQRARKLLGIIEDRERADGMRREQAWRDDQARYAREQARVLETESQTLLDEFDRLAKDGDPQRHGYRLEGLLNRVFAVRGIPVAESFRRVSVHAPLA